MFNVTVSRFFTSGILAGLTIPQTMRQSFCPAIGATHEVRKPYGNSSPYVDTVESVTKI